MRTTMTVLSLVLLQLTLPCSAFATNVEEELTPEQEQQQLWDTACRAHLPYGQGDLEAALLFKLRQCVNEKKNAWLIEQKEEKERERLSQRSEREKARRDTVLRHLRAGSRQRIENSLPRRAEQSTLLQRYRTRHRYQQVHESLRLPGSTNATTED